MGVSYTNIKIKKQKDIPVLKNIPICMIDKYWIDVVAEQYDILEIGFEIKDVDGRTVATVIEIVDDKALLQLGQLINYFEAIEFGITMDRIIFDQPQEWLSCQDVRVDNPIQMM